MAKTKIEWARLKNLPTERPLPNGKNYFIENEDGSLSLYSVTSGGEPKFIRGVSEEDASKINRLTPDELSKLEGLDTQSEIDDKIQAVDDKVGLASGSVIPITGTVLPQSASIPSYITTTGKADLQGGVSGKTYTQTGGSPITVGANNGRYAYYNKVTNLWTAGEEYPLPNVEGTDSLESEEIPKGKAVKSYVDPIKEKADFVAGGKNINPIIHKDLTATNTSYGVISIYGWGFPIKSRQNISVLTLKLVSTTTVEEDGGATQQRIIVKENDINGVVLFDSLYNQTIPGDSFSRIYNFNFETPIANPNNTKLWVEIYFNGPVGIYRHTPATVFTSEEGYPFPRYTVINDMGASGSLSGSSSSYYDIYHEVTTTDIEMDFTDDAKQKIEDISIDSIPQGIVDSSEIVNSVFSKEIIESGEFTIFNDGVGPYSNDKYKVGFPIGVLEPFTRITLPIYYANTKIKPSNLFVNIRKQNRTGEIIAVSQISVFPNSTATGRYNIDFIFDNPLDSEDKLFVELVSDGEIGVYGRYPNPTSIFTQENGYPPYSYSNNPIGVLGDSPNYLDIYFTTNLIEERVVLSNVVINSLEQDEDNIQIPNENERISFTGSSVTWGDGFLQSGYVGEYIKWRQTKVAKAILPSSFSNGTIENNRKYFLGEALRLEGVGQFIEFELHGNEVSVIHSMDRVNIGASEIEVYIDNTLHDTFNNFNNSPIGTTTKSFTGNGTDVMFDLGQAFTYNHSVSVGGVDKVVTQNVAQGTGFTIPTGSDCAIIRRLGIGSDGKPQVTHWLWFKVAPNTGDNIAITYNYGSKLTYEKTTIGENADGVVECPYGDGNVSFDPLSPSSIGTGLDFRQTDERVVKTYRFTETKTRKVRIQIKGNLGGSTGTPYFIFNFATNRYFHFQNAGIGGWDLWDLDRSISQDYLRGWQRVAQFNPDKLVIESTPNDDWVVKGYKVYTEKTVSIGELRPIRTLPLRQIAYQSASNNYLISRWRGKITAITETSVTFSGVIDTPINAGDVLLIGQYWTNNFDYIERTISSVDGNILFFNKPISKDEIIYNDISDFIGKDMCVRTLDSFKSKLELVISKFRETIDCPIYVLENPMPDLLARDLWGYPIVMKNIALNNNKVFTINYNSLRKWQESQTKLSVNLNVASATLDSYINKRVLEFDVNGRNTLAADVLINGVSIYGKRAVVENGWAYVVNQSNTGSSLNKAVSATTNSGQVFNGRKPRLVILDDTLTSGTVTVRYASQAWSSDSTHMNANSSRLYADFLRHI